MCENQPTQDLPLLWGHYFFFKNEDIIAKQFTEVIEEEEYANTIKSTKYLLTSSVHTALESLASGNNPVFHKREDKKDIQNYNLIEEYNIPEIKGSNIVELNNNFDEIIKNYPKTKKIEQINLQEIKDEILPILEKFKHIKPALDYI